MGVFEYTFSISSGSNRGVQWRIYDVGGARNQRQAWAPYFEDGKVGEKKTISKISTFVYSECHHIFGAYIRI